MLGLLYLVCTIASPFVWYWIGKRDGYAKGYVQGATDKRKQLVDGMDNLLFAGILKAYIRRDAVVNPPDEEPWQEVSGLSVTDAVETKH